MTTGDLRREIPGTFWVDTEEIYTVSFFDSDANYETRRANLLDVSSFNSAGLALTDVLENVDYGEYVTAVVGDVFDLTFVES